VLVAGALFAASAQAEQIDYNTVPTLGTSNFQFTGGYVNWYYSGTTLEAELRGTLVLKNAAGSCARMRLDYLYHGPFVGTPVYGGEVCASDGDKHEWTVDLVTPSTASIDNVRVSLETKTGSHGWSILDDVYSPPQPPSDTVREHSVGFDFGNGTYDTVTKQTTGSATMYWNRGDNGAAYSPRLIGTLWLNKVAGVCARMHLIYNDDVGHKIIDKYGGPACAAGNDLQAFNVDLSPYTATGIRSVTVRMQTQATNGSWNDITGSSNTVYIDN
jgi:hypothetical protein